MKPKRYIVLFKDQHDSWNCFSAFESLNPHLDNNLALQRAQECAQQTKQNYQTETQVFDLDDVATQRKFRFATHQELVGSVEQLADDLIDFKVNTSELTVCTYNMPENYDTTRMGGSALEESND